MKVEVIENPVPTQLVFKPEVGPVKQDWVTTETPGVEHFLTEITQLPKFDRSDTSEPDLSQGFINVTETGGEIFVGTSGSFEQQETLMAKNNNKSRHGGRTHRLKIERTNIKKKFDVPSGTRVDIREGKPCKWDGKKWVPLTR